jgi:fibronectin type 3 domain-containing protein
MFQTTKKMNRATALSRLSSWVGLIASGAMLIGVSVSAANAATYYVATNGSDTTGTGTSAAPWQTLSKAANTVPANQGHIIHLTAGTYTMTSPVWIAPGVYVEGENTATDNTKTVIVSRVTSFPGTVINVSTGNVETSPGGTRNLTIDCDNFTGKGGIGLRKVSNYTLDNVTIRNVNGDGLNIGVTGDGTKGTDISNIEIKNCKISKTKGPNINGDSWMGFNIHDNVFDNSDPNEGPNTPSPYSDNIRVNYVGNTRIHHNTMYAPNYIAPLPWAQQPVADTICLFYMSGGNEIDNNDLSQWVSLVGQTSLNGYDKIAKFHHNYVHFSVNVTGPGIELNIGDSDVNDNYFENTQIGVLIDPGRTALSNIRIFNNVFRRTFPDPTYDSEAFNFRLEGDSTSGPLDKIAIYNNVIDGFKIFFKPGGLGSYTNLNVKNNVVLDVERIVDWSQGGTPLYNSNFTNNVWHFTQQFELYSPPPASQNVVFSNNYPGAKTGLSAASGAGLQLSGALPNPYYAPISSSTLVVDKGTANISPTITLSGFSGNAPDIGRYEWTGGGTPTPTAPSAPTGLTASAGNAQVSLTWGAVSGATSYTVKRSTASGGPYTDVATNVTSASYTNTGLTNGTTYYYVVTAQNSVGSSANSNQVPATPTAPATPTVPSAPTNLAASAGNAQVSLTWTAVSGATGYTVKRSTTSGGSYSTVQSGLTTNSYTNTGLTNGTTYYYVVTAENSVGSSANSNQASATPTAPPATSTQYQAESATSSGNVQGNNNHAGYTGSGFLTILGQGGAITWSNVSSSSAGSKTISVRYSQSTGSTKTYSLYVNGVKQGQLSFPSTSSWSTWSTATMSVPLNAGTNTIAIKWDAGDNGATNIDRIDVP